MAENDKLFREKPLESVSSPESLNEYLRVTTPKVWLVLIAIALILIGAIIWACLGHIDATTKVAVVSDGKATVCLVPEKNLDAVVADPQVKVEDKTLKMTPDVLEPTTVTEDTNVYVLMAGDLEPGDIVYEIEAQNIDAGVYEGEIVTESISPISFLLN